jgi:hypothetical protein
MDVANVSNTVTIVIIVAKSIAYIINVHNYYKKVAMSITNVSMSVTIEYFLCNPGITQRVCNPL